MNLAPPPADTRYAKCVLTQSRKNECGQEPDSSGFAAVFIGTFLGVSHVYRWLLLGRTSHPGVAQKSNGVELTANGPAIKF